MGLGCYVELLGGDESITLSGALGLPLFVYLQIENLNWLAFNSTDTQLTVSGGNTGVTVQAVPGRYMGPAQQALTVCIVPAELAVLCSALSWLCTSHLTTGPGCRFPTNC